MRLLLLLYIKIYFCECCGICSSSVLISITICFSCWFDIVDYRKCLVCEFSF